MHSPPASFVRSLLLASIFSAATLCHPEEPSLAKPYLTEATGLVGSRCPEATRMKRASSSAAASMSMTIALMRVALGYNWDEAYGT